MFGLAPTCIRHTAINWLEYLRSYVHLYSYAEKFQSSENLLRGIWEGGAQARIGALATASPRVTHRPINALKSETNFYIDRVSDNTLTCTT